MASMSTFDLEVCRHTLSVLKSDKHKNNNYIFMEPVDTNIHTSYLSVIDRPMDLRTLGENLENGVYKARQEFFNDAKIIFKNAQVFHKGNKQTAWIIKCGNAMLKIVNREEKAADKKAMPKTEKKIATDTKKAPSLKLKLSSKSAPVASSSSHQAPSSETANKPKLSIKLGSGKTEATAPPAKPAPKLKKPKLKLSLSSKTKKPTTTPTSSAPLRAPSRGKELPKGVTAPASTKPAKQKKAPKKSKAPSTVMSEEIKAQCFKVLAGLKRRQPQNVVWFLRPISDKMVVDDYRAKIPHPMDMGTMATKLERNDYSSVNDFVRDVRRTFGNCLRYNTSVKDGFRPVAMEMQSTSEELMGYFLGQVPYPRLLYCWKLCVSVLDALLNLTNPSDGHQTAHYFLHPVSFYCGGSFPPDYLQKMKRPMDFGTVTSNLMEGVYTSAAAFCADCRLVLQNCYAYYDGKEEGQLFMSLAKRLEALMTQQLDALMRYDASPRGARAAALADSTFPTPPKPSEELLLGILSDLRNLTYTDKFTKLSEAATRSFEKPVDLVQNPDYAKFVKTPMDLSTVELNVRSSSYATIEDFEYDCNLIFRDCEAYNAPRRNDHMVSIAKFCMKNLRKIITNRLKANTVVAAEASSVSIKREAPPSEEQGPSKKAKIEPPVVSAGKTVPRISITAPAALAATKSLDKANRTKSPKPQKMEDAKSVPLHVAIAQVKERFPLRRPLKYLEPWEAACSRFFRELMKHPWISAARPKFIFVVPVPILFPDLQEAYTAKIRKPMDLTTVEAKLLQGGLYRDPQDMVDDVALVFSNAVIFNRSGKETGDLLSSAYYDASVQLLRYSRWLSLEVLSPYFGEDSPAETVPEGEPALMSWKLTASNKKASREEMESIVLNELIDKSMIGDRYTWMEAECEKLLKALRHQSDAKKMMYFIKPEYPPDYAAFISKPMDYDRVNRRLQNRDYDTFGEVISDLRLIFSNALKYNARAKGTTTVSGLAYDGAVYMSEKLEAAVDKMMISASDRIERERIEHAIAEREIEVAERAEEEKMRAQWTGNSGAKPMDSTVETVETVRIINRQPPKRREIRDFESYFDEDEGGHEQSYIDAMRLQKLIFEKQKQEREVLKSEATSVGVAVFSRLQQQQQHRSTVLIRNTLKDKPGSEKSSSREQREEIQVGSGSSALEELNRTGREKIKIAISKKSIKSKKMKATKRKDEFRF